MKITSFGDVEREIKELIRLVGVLSTEIRILREYIESIDTSEEEPSIFIGSAITAGDREYIQETYGLDDSYFVDKEG